ncbi:hypothetical protein BJX61DRAFT_552965 [Aspergillus egyptiacus]|nr:hypothetical protein BJX61DRAFT_552965 [Aspergillus egyptiacus]
MASVPSGEPEPPAYRARSYQLEMFEASLNGNIIVAMGTGSGKTHILLNSDLTSQLIWFLAPTVALCLQQHKVVTQHIPAAKSRTLTGLDKVELWTEQTIWDAVLKDIQVVISTHAVLADALTHGFVNVTQLGLIIFDEAHHCARKHPANKIMRDFYHPAVAKLGSDAVPRILGLTASVGNDREQLRTIEANLDSVCTTPQVHRHELLEHTHRPELRRILFTPDSLICAPRFGGTKEALLEIWGTLDIEDDPYVKKLRSTSPNGEALQKVLATGKSYCSEQLKRFVDRALHVYEELGVWAADYFIWKSTEQLRGQIYDNSLMLDMDIEERSYLAKLLSQIPIPDFNFDSPDPADFPVSPKFEALLSFLMSTDETDFSGLVFAQQRATVAVMAKLLSVHPLTRHRFRTGGFVGMGTSTNRKDMLGDLLTAKMQRGTLEDFRGGRKNLVVATDVLEEGIDVSACSVVVCYNVPPNLKSFVQRRGRARRQHSTYAILLSTLDEDSRLDRWHHLEKLMEEAYQDDRRHLEELRALETINEDVEARFCVESTGAMLTADNATQHLYHFCSSLPHQAHVDNKPMFSFEKHEGDLVKGIVTLPSSVHPSVRRAEGKSWWRTERAARKEAAFQAYKALYEHGLVNDNLLVLTKSSEFIQKELVPLPSMQDVSEQYDPWIDWASLWSCPNVHLSRIVIRQNGDVAYMKLVTPAVLPLLEPMTLFWDNETTYTVELEAVGAIRLTAEDVELMRKTTALYLQAATTKRMNPDRDFTALFSPNLPQSELGDWLSRNEGHESALDVFSSNRSLELMGIVRDHLNYGEVLLFRKWVPGPNDTLELECDSYPKRRNLLQQQTLSAKRSADDEPESTTKKRILSAAQCTIDKLPAPETIFGRFIPVIIDRLEAALIASKLCETVLRDIPFTELRHIITAISMPSSQAPTDYQRYEFFGDSVLKFTTTFSLFYQNPEWHEGYLSITRDAIVQNSRLTRAALTMGLETFIISKMFRPRKWSAPLISEKLTTATTSPSQRPLSTKVLADVVESLIGAAYIDGGHTKAQKCISLFLPELQIITPDTLMSQDPPPSNAPIPVPIQHESLQESIGYVFTNRSLLTEALTHPSCQHDHVTQSYQRLEFLGDAVLDMLIVDTLLHHPTQFPQGEMTRIKHALVNANLLAFLCMEFSFTQPVTDVSIDIPISPSSTPSTRSQPVKPVLTTQTTTKATPLPSLLRLSPTTPSLHAARTDALSRHHALSPLIRTALKSAPAYPWIPLSRLNADKFFSDIIEALLGAIFVDSGGDLAACTIFAERLGLLAYLRRVLDEGVDVVHPVSRAQILCGSGVKFETRRVSPARDLNGGGEGLDSGSEGEGGNGEGEATYMCTAVSTSEGTAGLGLEGIVVSGCLSAEEAEVGAANLVIERLKGLGLKEENLAEEVVEEV